jgi:dihydroxy-acid dehydratase
VGLAREGLRPSAILNPEAFTNALAVLLAVGGSTNAVIHLTAIARRAGVPLSLDDLQVASERVPLLVDCKPAGTDYLEDLHHAGGVPALLRAMEPLLDGTTIGVTGRPLSDLLAEAPSPGDWQTTIRPLAAPLGPTGALTVLGGSLAPGGAVIKSAAATPALLRHRGPAAVFESPEDVARRIDDPALALTPDHVLVLRNAGPVAAGMPEAGAMPIPRYLAGQGVTDMVRVSDARMSGTAYGTVVLHCAPEAAAGGPLALVRDGDKIELDVGARTIELRVEAGELARRWSSLRPPPRPARGWRHLHAGHVLQAPDGADLDFLV